MGRARVTYIRKGVAADELAALLHESLRAGARLSRPRI
jgi:hypothetical protein